MFHCDRTDYYWHDLDCLLNVDRLQKSAFVINSTGEIMIVLYSRLSFMHDELETVTEVDVSLLFLFSDGDPFQLGLRKCRCLHSKH